MIDQVVKSKNFLRFWIRLSGPCIKFILEFRPSCGNVGSTRTRIWRSSTDVNKVFSFYQIEYHLCLNLICFFAVRVQILGLELLQLLRLPLHSILPPQAISYQDSDRQQQIPPLVQLLLLHLLVSVAL